MERSRFRKLHLLLALVGAGALLTTIPAAALNVIGTSGPDVLRGTKSSDWITGKSGADRLFGREGNDILTGGPGADYVHGGPGLDRLQLRDGERDRAVCGPGRDTVIADARDVAKADCEVVLRPESEPAPPQPLPVAATPGSYKGATQTGNFVFFDVLSSRKVRGWRVNDVRRKCDGPLVLYGPITVGPDYVEQIQRSGRFETEWDYPTTIVLDENADRARGQGYTRIVGTIDGSSAFGTVLATFDFEVDGRHFRCTNSTESWTAHRLLP